jgi:hypothetical protein
MISNQIRKLADLVDSSPEKTEWNSPEGKRRVEKIEDVPGRGVRYFIRTENLPSLMLLKPEELAGEIRRDESRFESRKKVKIQQEQELLDNKKVIEDKRGLHGFTEGMSPIKQRKIEEVLDTTQGFNGVFIKRRIYIENVVRDGAQVTSNQGGRRLELPKGTFYTERDITKVGMDYAEFLISNS